MNPALHDGCAYHIIHEGNNWLVCFSEDVDYIYLDLLKKSSRKYKVSIHAIAFMGNHVQLLTTPNNEAGNSRMIQTIGRSYA
ncbi:transposase [Pleionea mediterranea]|uniref:transposase n=1 Tax=Pleionea mediterranea TaxID=523701 RepID=UPI000D6CD091|nr:transposase [Pleionea mediterranea]